MADWPSSPARELVASACWLAAARTGCKLLPAGCQGLTAASGLVSIQAKRAAKS